MQLPNNVLYLTGSIKCQVDTGLVHVKCYQKINDPTKLSLIGELDTDLASREFKSQIKNLPIDPQYDKTIYISVSKLSAQKVIASVYREGNLYYIGYNNKRSAKLKLYDMVSLLVGMGVDGDSSILDDRLLSTSNWIQISLDKLKTNKRSAYWPEHTLGNESMNSNNPVINRLAELNNFSPINEVLHDINLLLDDRAIQYMNDNINDPARKDRYLKAVARFQALAEKQTDPRMALYYEYRAYASAPMAQRMAREFYQKEIRSGTYSDVTISTDGEEFSTIDSVDYGTGFVSKGMFANLGAKGQSPEKIYEVDDLLTKLFDSKFLDTQDRILLVTYLVLGTGPKLRTKSGATNRQGLDLEGVMNNPPKELKLFEEQVTKLLQFGIDPDDITSEKILRGVNKNDAEEGSVGVAPLMSTTRISSAQANIKKALVELIGTDDMTQIKKFLLTSPLTPLGGFQESKLNEAVDPNNSIVLDAIDSYLGGESVTQSNLIRAIVYAVNVNIKRKTRLSKSKIFSGSVKQVATSYLKLAKSGKPENTMIVQDMLLAPVMDAMDPRLD